MNLLQALKYLRDDPNGCVGTTDEWSEAGMWRAVCTIIRRESEESKNTWTAIELDNLLREADR